LPIKIEDVIYAPGMGAFFYDDQAAIRGGALQDGFVYGGPPMTPGFKRVRESAKSLGIGLRLSNGSLVWGDAMSVQYSGAAGRDPMFAVDEALEFLRSVVAPRLLRLPLEDFRTACTLALAPDGEGHTPSKALAYGVSQALLRAVASEKGTTMAEVICEEFNFPVIARRIPIFAQSGDARRSNVDKMILKSVDVLPHGLINSREKFGPKGRVFRDYARWVSQRIREIGSEDYRPTLHFDLYGLLGLEFGLDIEVMADEISLLSDEVGDFPLNIESPADFRDTEAHIAGYAALVRALERKGCAARIVVDERCNTLSDIRAFAKAGAGHIIQIKTPDVGSFADVAEAVQACKQHGMRAYVGGSCAETEISAQVSVHVAVASQADMMLAKPGMGVDEGLTIVGNEQARLLAVLGSRNAATSARV
jgi:methylaspartate ammonia-lyase